MTLFRRLAWPVVSLASCLGLLWCLPRLNFPRPPSESGVRDAFRVDIPERPTLSLRGGLAPTEPQIRVGLKETPVASFTLSLTGPFQVRESPGGKVLWQGKSLPPTRVRAVDRAIELGEKRFSSGVIEVVVTTPPGIWVDQAQYRGSLRIVRSARDRVLPVNVLPLEQYLASVVDSEMPAAFPDEARQAQAIVARTYALYQQAQAPTGGPVDLYASTRSQKYRGYQYKDERGRMLAGESASARAIVEATRGLVGTHRGELFCTYYCAVCGGSTVAGRGVFADAAPPLRPVVCEHCHEARLYRWQVKVSRREVEEALRKLGRAKGHKLGTLRSLQSVPDREGFYRVRDERGEWQVTGAELRQALSGRGLSSPRFTTREQGTDLVFEGRGHGHGVGLCQWGARGLAQQGWTARRIFAYYYPGAQLADAGYR